MTPAPFPDRDTIASKFASFGEQEKAYIVLLMENSAQDENLIDGLHRHLDNAASASFLNTLKLDHVGKWIGEAAPVRLQDTPHGGRKIKPASRLCSFPDRAFAFRRAGKGLPAGSDLTPYYLVAARPTERPAS
ncbi:hypothetical protein PMI09_00447 [Rhizobium sp. CF122]|nr:hypothetical protein PMI09_00447 [Rhizobium sp. CF122]